MNKLGNHKRTEEIIKAPCLKNPPPPFLCTGLQCDHILAASDTTFTSYLYTPMASMLAKHTPNSSLKNKQKNNNKRMLSVEIHGGGSL